MNKKRFNQVLSLHKKGVSTNICILAMIQMELGQARSLKEGIEQRELAKAIDDFYSFIYKEIVAPIREEKEEENESE